MANLNRRGIPMPFVSRSRRVDPPSTAPQAVAEPAANHADHACLADARDDLVAAEFLEPGGDERGRFVNVEADFRPLVQVAAPGGHFVLHFGGAIEDWHFLSVLFAGRELRPRLAIVIDRRFAMLRSHRLNSTR